MKKSLSVFLAVATALAIAPAALATSLCPDVADAYARRGATAVQGGACAVTLSISNQPNANNTTQVAGQYWDTGSIGLTVGNLVSLDVSVIYTAASGDQPFFEFDISDPSGNIFGTAQNGATEIGMVEFQAVNLSGNDMIVDPSTTLFNISTQYGYILGQSTVHTLDDWLLLYPALASASIDWVGVGLYPDGSSSSQTLTVNALDVTETPEPSSLLLLGTGLAGLAGMLRRKLRV